MENLGFTPPHFRRTPWGVIPLCTQAVAMATILAPTQKLPRLRPGREWRASRATPCEGKAVAIFAWGRELLPRRPPGYTGVGSTSEHHNIFNAGFVCSTKQNQRSIVPNKTSGSSCNFCSRCCCCCCVCSVLQRTALATKIERRRCRCRM